VVTCGGLCPGLNDIIRGIVNQCHHQYGITRIYGFRYGYEGLVQRYGHTPVMLKPASVAQAHNFGGTLLGSSRGKQDIGEMVDTLEDMGVDILFVIGGDGTLRGAAEIVKEIEVRGLKKAVVGIPKTIDNDIMYLDKSFGFETAFAAAVQAVKCAYTEATGAVNGIGLVKLMGRDSGFIACFAALAGSNVDFVLIPEVPFELEGQNGLLENLRYRLAKRGSAVIGCLGLYDRGAHLELHSVFLEPALQGRGRARAFTVVATCTRSAGAPSAFKACAESSSCA
jgi:6-phosphofructokinase 1